MRRRLSREQIDQIVALREAGRSPTFIRLRVGCSHGAVVYQCLRAGLDPFDGGVRHPNQAGAYSADDDATIEALQLEGVNGHQIAKALGRKWSSVNYRIMLLAARAEKVLAA